MAAAAGVTLPAEYLATAGAEGIKKSAAAAYIALQGSLLAGMLAKAMPWFRDRLVYDNRFLFKVGAEASFSPNRVSLQVDSCSISRSSPVLP